MNASVGQTSYHEKPRKGAHQQPGMKQTLVSLTVRAAWEGTFVLKEVLKNK